MATPLTRLIGPGTTRTSQTLYDRIGGEDKLEKIVSNVYQAMKADKEIGKMFARFRLEKLQERTVDYLRGEWGGDGYQGSDLFLAHSHLGVNNHQYDIMMKCYVRALKKERIGKQETQEVLESLEKMRAPCVDANLKFKEMFLKHNEREARKAGGDGWTVISMKQSDREAKEKETLRRLAEMNIQESQAAKRKAQETPPSSPTSPDVKKETVAPEAAPKAKAKAKARLVKKKVQAETGEKTAPVVDDANTSVSTTDSSAKNGTDDASPSITASSLFVFAPSDDEPPNPVPIQETSVHLFKEGIIAL